MDIGPALTWGFVLTVVSAAAVIVVWIVRWRAEREREEGERRWEMAQLFAEIEVQQRRAEAASQQLAGLEQDAALLQAVTALYRQVAEIDPAAVNIPPLFLADWLEDRGIPAVPLREYGRRWPEGGPDRGTTEARETV